MGGVRELLFVDPCDGLLPCVCVREDRDFLFLCCSVSPFLQADGRALLSKAVRQEKKRQSNSSKKRERRVCAQSESAGAAFFFPPRVLETGEH